LYALSTPKANFFRPVYLQKPRSTKIGKSEHLLRCLNEYTLWDKAEGLTVHCLLLMPYETNDDKHKIEAAEWWVLGTLKAMYPNVRYWPGVAEKFRMFFRVLNGYKTYPFPQ